MAFRIGYLYTPATSREDAAIFDWISCSRLPLRTIKQSFFKVAHVLPIFAQTIMGSEVIYESVYMDLSEHTRIPPTKLPIPASWRKVCVYTDYDLITRPVLQRITQTEPEGSIFPSDAGTSFDGEEFLSALNDWMNPNPSTFGIGSASALGS